MTDPLPPSPSRGSRAVLQSATTSSAFAISLGSAGRNEAVPRLLSGEHIAALIDRFDRFERRFDGPVLDIEVRDDEIHLGALPRRVLPAEWVTWPVSTTTTAVGIVLPLGARRGLVVVVDRAGRAEWLVVDNGAVDPTASTAGQLADDLCRIRLGFPSLPPDRSPDWYWLGCWLAGVIETATDPTQRSVPLDVISVAAAHPAIESDEVAGLDFAGLCGFVVERHREHVAIADWACIRLDALDDRLHSFHDVAVALDVGAFSRWVTAFCAPLGDLAATLTARCSPLGLRLIGSVIADTMLHERVGRSSSPPDATR